MFKNLLGKKKKEETPGNEAEDKAEGSAAAGGEGGAAAPEIDAAAAKKAKRKRMILICVIIALVLGIGAGGYVLFMRHTPPATPSDASAPGATQAAASGGEGMVYYTLPEFLVNLNTASKQASFLKMTVVLQMKSQDDAKKVEANLPRVLDNMNTYLREMRATDLSGSAGIYRLREELLVRVNKTVAPVQVGDILFKEIIVQ